MSVILEFAMFPTDKGSSVSEYVSRILKVVDQAGLPYQLTPMGMNWARCSIWCTKLTGSWRLIATVSTPR
jgi:hypothetical protein